MIQCDTDHPPSHTKLNMINLNKNSLNSASKLRKIYPITDTFNYLKIYEPDTLTRITNYQIMVKPNRPVLLYTILWKILSATHQNTYYYSLFTLMKFCKLEPLNSRTFIQTIKRILLKSFGQLTIIKSTTKSKLTFKTLHYLHLISPLRNPRCVVNHD